MANKTLVWCVPADTEMANKALVYCGVSQQTQKWRIKPRCGVYILYSWTPKCTTSRTAQAKLRLRLWHLATGSVAVAMSLAYDNSMCSCDNVCGIGQIDVYLCRCIWHRTLRCVSMSTCMPSDSLKCSCVYVRGIEQ